MHSKPQIVKINSDKAQRNKRLLGLIIFITAINILFHLGLLHIQVWNPFALVSLFSFLLVLIQLNKNKQLVRAQTNEQIMQKLASSGFPSATHHLKKKVSQKDFTKSKLYDNLPFIYTGDNLLRTENWFVSNVTVTKKLAKNKETITVFDGVFAKFKNQIPIDGLLIIKPLLISDKTKIPEVLQKLMHRYFTPAVSSIATQNPEFDKEFEVFSSSPELQTKIMNSGIINIVLEMKNKLKNCHTSNSKALGINRIKDAVPEISFVGDYIYVGIRGLKLFSSNGNYNGVDDAEGLQKCIELIKLASQMNNTSIILNN